MCVGEVRSVARSLPRSLSTGGKRTHHDLISLIVLSHFPRRKIISFTNYSNICVIVANVWERESERRSRAAGTEHFVDPEVFCIALSVSVASAK